MTDEQSIEKQNQQRQSDLEEREKELITWKSKYNSREVKVGAYENSPIFVRINATLNMAESYRDKFIKTYGLRVISHTGFCFGDLDQDDYWKLYLQEEPISIEREQRTRNILYVGVRRAIFDDTIRELERICTEVARNQIPNLTFGHETDS